MVAAIAMTMLTGSTLQQQFQHIEVLIPGEGMRAFLVAWEDFTHLKEIPTSQKRLENYGVGLGLESGEVTVEFVPRLAKGEHARPGCCTSLGRDVKYYISLSTYQIEKRVFPI
jgi:hypothetical protein